MKTLHRLFLLAALLGAAAGVTLQAQPTITPNTTTCAAQTKTQTTVCLTATTSVVDQTGVYIDQEYEVVQLSNNTTVCTGPCNVRVLRNSRNAGSGPTAHVNSAIAWLALTPSASIVPGANGFSLGSNLTDVGTCVRSAQIYLPHIFVNRGIKRDCTIGTTLAATAGGFWGDYAPQAGLDFPSPTPITTITTNGALAVASGNYTLITKAGVIALTLMAPTAGVQDGMIIVITSANGAYADTLTATALLQNGANGSPFTTATFGVTSTYIGGTITLKAWNGFWYVIASVGVALT